MPIPRHILEYIEKEATREELIELMDIIQRRLAKLVPFRYVVIINEGYHNIAHAVRMQFPFVEEAIIISKGVYPIEEAYNIGVRAAKVMSEDGALVLSGHLYSMAVATSATFEKIPHKTNVIYFDVGAGSYRYITLNKVDLEGLFRVFYNEAPVLNLEKVKAVVPISMKPNIYEALREYIGGEAVFIHEGQVDLSSQEAVIEIAMKTAAVAVKNEIPIVLYGPGILSALAVAFAVGYGTSVDVIYYDMASKKYLSDRLHHLDLKSALSS